ncbi:DUF1707 domain-containing protein [Saccharopolyspora sp. NFXS83]|uniref:DUF1707 SHOCT-like domain-containing protein n=1 Tax=Saccharopolyspora sp. NFXS83 TaxID=2993560 RepID=UPI00224B035F|nr:DUF1707 domain-containing protein [Saccharopolyspora sp. NFXS83]MCX2728631.1 DUF1707 domain-containing protein [Saccharopolyspora sp. NFXS83]
MDDAERPAVRASDADRERVAELLRVAFDEGRLGLVEYDERVRDAYGAVTRADLVPLTADLPATAPAPAAGSERAPAARSRWRGMEKQWREWAQVSFLLVGIWLVISLASGEMITFFPIFPMGIWGVVLVAQALFGDSDESDDADEEEGPGGVEGPGRGGLGR